MSDEFYAVQYKNMQSGSHHVAIYSLEEKAQEFHDYINKHSEHPETDDFYEPMNFIVDYEIDHRDPPTHCTEAFDELRLIYVNKSNSYKGTLHDHKNMIVPDVY